MKNMYLSLAALAGLATTAYSQIDFDPTVEMDFLTDQIIVPASPLKTQVIFIGGEDLVQTRDANGNPNGTQVAKQWHDFIGLTEDDANPNQYYISVNHEMILADDKIGDGGGMTVFKMEMDTANDSIIVLQQTLADGRQGQFFNVDFANTVGETGMNCGGIVSQADGRIWTAEEWFRTSTSSIYNEGNGVRDTADWTIDTDIPGDFDGSTIRKFENFNWMVEIDPREAVAVRKQYNWGRNGYEGGVVMPDNKTVYLGEDGTPGWMVKFVADVAGDFTQGTTYAYKHDAAAKWVEIDNSSLSNMLNFDDLAVAAGATMFNRLEWVAYGNSTGNVYFTETGRDNPGGRWADANTSGGVFAPHHIARATAQGTTPDADEYWDYYGRVIELDVTTDEVSVYLEAGPAFTSGSPTLSNYPDIHLTNPDGLSFITVNGQEYMIVQEDLNGTSFGRVPAGVSNRTCELFLLDMSINNPEPADLLRITAVPQGAEVTGAVATPDGKAILVNSQHPSTSNPYPFNNSLTFAIIGFDKPELISSLGDPVFDGQSDFEVFPNPATRELRFNKTVDVAIFNMTGQRLMVQRQVNRMDISNLTPGNYVVKTLDGAVKKLIVQ